MSTFFVVVREIEGARRVSTAFPSLDAARTFYDDAVYVCDLGPDEDVEGDPTIVSNCWLYAADAPNETDAGKMVSSGHARLIASYCDE